MIAEITLVVTALPIVLYLCESEINVFLLFNIPYFVQLSGNACHRSHSIGVNILILPFIFIFVLCPETFPYCAVIALLI